MLKALDRAMFVAETDTRRRRAAPKLREIESKLTRGIMAQSLALEIIKNSQRPTSELIAELLDIECQTGKFVGDVLQNVGGKHQVSVDLKGVLAGAVSFIPMNPFRKRATLKASLGKFALEILRQALIENPSFAKEKLGTLLQPPPLPLTDMRVVEPALSQKKVRSKKVGSRKKVKRKSQRR